jgi:ribosomal protein S18 acetylase RimI-like enzyme
VRIREYNNSDFEELKDLVAKFRVFLSTLKSIEKNPDYVSAAKELNTYIDKKHPIFIAEINQKIVGYIVCRIEDGVVWVESLYVSPDYRNNNIGSSLFEKAEKVSEDLNCETLYHWVHPNNHRMINFLDKQGYDVLNLIEIRKKRKDEETKSKVKVNDHEFKY